MITTGIIKEINNDKISVEMFDAGVSCSSGNCASCSSKGKTKIFEALNTRELPVKTGSFIEMELSTSKGADRPVFLYLPPAGIKLKENIWKI